MSNKGCNCIQQIHQLFTKIIGPATNQALLGIERSNSRAALALECSSAADERHGMVLLQVNNSQQKKLYTSVMKGKITTYWKTKESANAKALAISPSSCINNSDAHITLLLNKLLHWEVHGILKMQRLISPRGPSREQLSGKKLNASWRFRTWNIFWK